MELPKKGSFVLHHSYNRPYCHFRVALVLLHGLIPPCHPSSFVARSSLKYSGDLAVNKVHYRSCCNLAYIMAQGITHGVMFSCDRSALNDCKHLAISRY